MLDKIQEALDILQEECAEVIVEVSKCRRFGIDALHYKTGLPHRDMLEQEIGDVLAMVDILLEQDIITMEGLDHAKTKKIAKLHDWSSIFK